jgi:HK97 family phage prohead protease
MVYDFSGYATKNDLKCADGRTIRRDAFADCDGMTVPLVWQHDHHEPSNVLGHAILENRPDGVYAYIKCNNTPSGRNAKDLVEHGDINALSIYANKLVQKGGDVLHGAIKEVSLVIAGANPGAMIDNVNIAHSEDGSDDEAIIYTDEFISVLSGDVMEHADEEKETKEMPDDQKQNKKEDEMTVEDVINTMNEQQKKVLMFLVNKAKESNNKDDEKESEEMKHNVFENEEDYKGVSDELAHSEMKTIIDDAKKYGSLKESFLAHADEYGITNIDYLFPEAKNVNNTPDFIQREMSWVSGVMSGVHHAPFSRIKSMHADITEDEARAKGYIKGKLKKEEVFSLLKRSTTPTTIYKKQKLDRDDIIDITDFDVVAWLKSEMRMMLDEEIARAILVGDGRLASDDDKINESNIRPIWTDADLYSIKKVVTTGDTDAKTAKNFIDTAIRSRKDYKGSGNPTLYTTEDMLTEMLLIEDSIGHKLYKTEAELATTLRVSRIVTVPVMEDLTRSVTVNGAEKTNTLRGIIVNLNDYYVGADKGGAINMFDDFDIDYNQQKYLIETRCSGALVKPFSAIILETQANGEG